MSLYTLRTLAAVLAATCQDNTISEIEAKLAPSRMDTVRGVVGMSRLQGGKVQRSSRARDVDRAKKVNLIFTKVL